MKCKLNVVDFEVSSSLNIWYNRFKMYTTCTAVKRTLITVLDLKTARGVSFKIEYPTAEEDWRKKKPKKLPDTYSFVKKNYTYFRFPNKLLYVNLVFSTSPRYPFPSRTAFFRFSQGISERKKMSSNSYAEEWWSMTSRGVVREWKKVKKRWSRT